MRYIAKDELPNIPNIGDVMACRYYHSFAYPDGIDALGDCGSEDADGKHWDIFHIHTETKDAYYGTPMLGMGLANCMILKVDTRPFLESELHHAVGMFGSHTRKMSKAWTVNITPIVSRWDNSE